jgi:hypothetical protein
MRIFSHPFDRRWSAAILMSGLAAAALIAVTPQRAPVLTGTAATAPGSGSTSAPPSAHRAAPAVVPVVELNAAARQQLLRAIVLSGEARPFGFFR